MQLFDRLTSYIILHHQPCKDFLRHLIWFAGIFERTCKAKQVIKNVFHGIDIDYLCLPVIAFIIVESTNMNMKKDGISLIILNNLF